jgi:hypothetical protein
MPLFLEPGQQYPVWLDSDAEKPMAERPVFFAKSQPLRGQQRVGEVLDLATSNPDITIGELFEQIISVLQSVFCGWKNMGGIDYAPERLAEVISYREARELLMKVMYNQHITAYEKKS